MKKHQVSSGAHQYSRLLTYYVSKRLEALADVDDYDDEKLTLANLLWFLRHVDSDDVVLAKLRTMVDSDKKRKAYLSRHGITHDAEPEYAEAADKIGRSCLSVLQCNCQEASPYRLFANKYSRKNEEQHEEV